MPEDFVIDNLRCNGDEDSINDCWWHTDENCNDNEGAGVICLRPGESNVGTVFVHGLRLRLDGGDTPFEGNVLATRESDNFEGPVCDDNFDINDAHVVCRQLGFGTAASITVNSHYGQVSSSHVVDDLNCSGTEDGIGACSFTDMNSENCSETEGAGVVCNPPS